MVRNATKSFLTGSSAVDVIERLKLLTGAKTDAALARLFNLSAPAIIRWRNEGSVPFRYCVETAEKHGASLDYVYRGVETSNVTSEDQDINEPLLEAVIGWRLSGPADVGTARKHGETARSIAAEYRKAQEMIDRLVTSAGLGRPEAVSVVTALVSQGRLPQGAGHATNRRRAG